MCKVIVKKPSQKAGFIICNHLYSRKDSIFTIKDLSSELSKQYNLNIKEEVLQKEINDMVKKGIIIRGFNSYKRVVM